MADTTTTTYSLTKPQVGASEDTWGTKLNTNLDSIDNLLDGTTVLEGPSLDSNASFVDVTDNTKAVQFAISGVTTSTTRTFTFPDTSDTFVGLAATQTLTNKTISGGTVSGTLSGSATLSGTITASGTFNTSGTFQLGGTTVSSTAAELNLLDGKSLAGADASLLTGTAGTSGNLAEWNVDGDLVDGPDVLDEDDMASDSATAVPTQQSTKAYVDSNGITQTTGSPAYYGARAWVNFDGTGTVSINGSENVSSITDNGTGDYTVNFSTNMPDANYAAPMSFNTGANGLVFSFSTSSFRIFLFDNSGSNIDSSTVTAAVFR